MRERVIWRPGGDAASELILSVQHYLDTQLLPVLGQKGCACMQEQEMT